MRFKNLVKQKIKGGSINEIHRNGNSDIQPIDLSAPFPFQIELQNLYDNIEFQLSEKRQRVICISSSTHREGNSTLVSYFALLLYRGMNNYSHAGKGDYLTPYNNTHNRILLIDANFRKPSIHRLFNLKNDVGFAEILQNKVDMDKSFDHQCESKLTIVTAGSSSESIRDYLELNSLQHYISAFKKYYNYIIIDTAPILPYSDTLAVARLCDGLVLNVKAECVKREVVQKAKLKLENARVNILGVVLNRRKYHIPKVIYNHL